MSAGTPLDSPQGSEPEGENERMEVSTRMNPASAPEVGEKAALNRRALHSASLDRTPNTGVIEPAPPAAGTHSENSEGQLADAYAQQIRDIYRLYHPEKLDDVDGLLAKYKGQEKEMYEKVKKIEERVREMR